MRKKPIVITPGEPLGIGLDIVITLIQRKLHYPYLIIADPDLMAERAEQLKLKFDPHKNILAVKKTSMRYVLDCLDIAVQLCLDKKAAALLTGPVNKAMLNNAGFHFTGHTHYLAQLSHTKDVVMYFESPRLNLALVTDHMPLAEVPQHITPERLDIVISTVAARAKRIAVCGLNPHAGEGGYLGQEENDIISPVIKKYQQTGLEISGPFSADSLFHEKNLKQYDAVIAMYHDQGLSVLKHRDFGKAVNITLGLPFLRTSVDHGTAIELAGTGKADAYNLRTVFSKTIALIKHQGLA